jgi:hypothetical protein
VLGYIDMGVREAATLVVGGGRPKDPPKGFFVVAPTMSADVDNPTTIARSSLWHGPAPEAEVRSSLPRHMVAHSRRQRSEG